MSLLIKSRSGHKIVFDDSESKEKVEILTNSGHQIVLNDSSGGEKMEIKDKTGANLIVIDSIQNTLQIKSQMKISIESQIIEIKAGATLNLQGGLIKIN